MAYEKAHSRDKYMCICMVAIRNIAKYLSIRLCVLWTPRCSSPGDPGAGHGAREQDRDCGPEVQQAQSSDGLEESEPKLTQVCYSSEASTVQFISK